MAGNYLNSELRKLFVEKIFKKKLKLILKTKDTHGFGGILRRKKFDQSRNIAKASKRHFYSYTSRF